MTRLINGISFMKRKANNYRAKTGLYELSFGTQAISFVGLVMIEFPF